MFFLIKIPLQLPKKEVFLQKIRSKSDERKGKRHDEFRKRS